MKKNINREWFVPKTLFKLFFFCLAFLGIVYTYISLSPKVLGIDIKSFAQTRNTYSTILKAKRGTIFDKDGDVLALNVYSYTVIAYLSPSRTEDISSPRHVVDPKATAKALSPLLNMTEEKLESLLTLEDRYQVELGPGGRGITELKKEEIEKLNLPGIDFIESSKRFYPNGDFASYIIGYAKNNEHEVDGKIVDIIDGELGIEYKYDDELKGVDGYLSYQQDANGYQIPETKEKRVDAQNGYDIYLTINSGIQRFLQEAMDEALENFSYDWLQIHVMDASTGDIVASAVSPSFDPNIREIVNYENNLTNVPYEPGSVMKTFTYLCAMEKGTYKGDKKFYSGSIKVEDSTISDWIPKGWGYITYDYGYIQSSNVGITNILLEEKFIDANDLKECLTKFGFGEKTGIELNEATGGFDFYYPIEVATAGFGQGIYVTPIQILQAYSIIANNGKMLKPHIISKIYDTNNSKVIYERKIEEKEKVLKDETVKKIKDLMYEVVNDPEASGSGYALASSGIDLIGKTGTAQIFEDGRYLDDQYIRSFAGMFPKEKPRYIIYAAVKKVSPDSSLILARAVKKIVKNMSKYLNIYKDNSDTIPSYDISNYVSKKTSLVEKQINDIGLVPVIIGDGEYVTKQSPNSGTILKGEKVFILTNDSEYTMPNMNGWSRKDVLEYFKLIGAKYKITGEGYVTKQSLSKGSIIDLDEEITIELKDKYTKQ